MQWIAIVVLGSMNIVVGAGFVLYRQSVKHKIIQMEQMQKEREYQAEYEKRKAEIVSLQSQINPHFLYNTLEVIRSQAILNKDIEAAEMAEMLANYFRYNISKKSDVVTLGEELDNIDNYINIQKRRFGKRIQYRVAYHTKADEARMELKREQKGGQLPFTLH